MIELDPSVKKQIEPVDTIIPTISEYDNVEDYVLQTNNGFKKQQAAKEQYLHNVCCEKKIILDRLRNEIDLLEQYRLDVLASIAPNTIEYYDSLKMFYTDKIEELHVNIKINNDKLAVAQDNLAKIMKIIDILREQDELPMSANPNKPFK